MAEDGASSEPTGQRTWSWQRLAVGAAAILFLTIGLLSAIDKGNSSALLAVGLVLLLVALFADRATRVIAKVFGQEVDITLDTVDSLVNNATLSKDTADRVVQELAQLTGDPALAEDVRARLEGVEELLEQLHEDAARAVDAVRRLPIPMPRPPAEVMRRLETPLRTATFKTPDGRMFLLRPDPAVRDAPLRCVVIEPSGAQLEAIVGLTEFEGSPAYVANYPRDFTTAGTIGPGAGMYKLGWYRQNGQTPVDEISWTD